MYTIEKTMEIAGGHKLDLSYPSPCNAYHGHNWKITVEVTSEKLNKDGMVIDFTVIKKIVNQLDHRYINDVIDCNPTAENIARWIHEQITSYLLQTEPCTAWVDRVEVEESEGNRVCYTT